MFKRLNDLAVAELIIISGGVGMIVQECLNMFKQGKSVGSAEYVHIRSSKDELFYRLI